ncbi:hypothetical protein ACLKMY_27190 [Paraburkholderia mimosarum]|uniref:hypothetical protein n=1 Tax=Paraburkholderia mimosarum TaxID=312026 RepID=UPI0039C20F6E
MAIDAIVANMDQVWSATGDGHNREAGTKQRCALTYLLQRCKEGGYRLLLMSDLNAEQLNSAISSALRHDGVTYFSAILSSPGGRIAMRLRYARWRPLPIASTRSAAATTNCRKPGLSVLTAAFVSTTH